MTNDYLRCSKDVEYCRDWYLEKNKGTWNQTIVKESTPSWVVKDMVDLLPEDSFTLDAKFIDIFSKSGIFLEVIRNKLMRNQAHIDKFPDPKERFNYITRNQLYALVWCDGVEDVVENQLALTTVAIYGRLVDNPNVYRVEIDRKTLKKEEGVHKFIELFYSEEYFKGMKFDVVVGNPPYNSDKYLDFVTIGHGLASKYSLWITPAKWQAKGGKENDTFREKIVPYMSKIVYYPDTDDVFEVRMSGGISYYIIDKNVHKIKNTKVISNRCDSFRSDWEEQEIISIHRSAINNIIRKCNGTRVRIEQIKGQKYVGDRDSKIPYKSNGKISVMQGEEECGHVNKTDIRETGINDIDKYKCVMHSMLISPVTNSDGTHLGIQKPLLLEPNQVPKGIYFEIYCSDSKETIKSVQSYFNCKLIRLLFYINAMSTYMEESNFDKIPDPGKFDHEFTDKELYDKYDLTQKEINIIESVIKERK